MNLTAVIISQNEEQNIEECILSIKFAKQIIVVDNASADRTVEIAKKHGAHVISGKYDSLARQREVALKEVKNDWIFYIDADERISPQLKSCLEKIINDKDSFEVYKVKRKNFYFRKYQWPFYAELERLFRKNALKGWTGDIHESPLFSGRVGVCSGYLDHYTHNDLTSMTKKTIKWSDVEAKIRFDSNHPKMSWWRFPRVMISSFIEYFIIQKGYKLGTAGLIESMFQSYSIFITYAKLWEMQNKSSNKPNSN